MKIQELAAVCAARCAGKTVHERTDLIAETLQSLLSASKPAAPEGWKLVPVEPTREMLDAYVNAKGRFHSARSDWAVMLAASPAAPAQSGEPFQARVQPWLMECFGPMIAGDREERNHRFFEEAGELVQACGMTASEAHQLVDYTWSREVGEKSQEVGGVMVTLAALCLANGLDMHAAGETELARIWTKVEAIRAKQAAKPKHSPLPAAPSAVVLDDEWSALRVLFEEAFNAGWDRSDDCDNAYNNGTSEQLSAAPQAQEPQVFQEWRAQYFSDRSEIVESLIARATSPQPVAQPVEQTRALTCCRMGCDKPSVCEHLGECRIDAAAQPASGGK